jgi:hypothetical protein
MNELMVLSFFVIDFSHPLTCSRNATKQWILSFRLLIPKEGLNYLSTRFSPPLFSPTIKTNLLDKKDLIEKFFSNRFRIIFGIFFNESQNM